MECAPLRLPGRRFVYRSADAVFSGSQSPVFRKTGFARHLRRSSLLAYSVGFAFYVENMGRYSVVYGSIGAVIVLLLWLYFSAITVIMGAELNHLLASRTRNPKAKRKAKTEAVDAEEKTK